MGIPNSRDRFSSIELMNLEAMLLAKLSDDERAIDVIRQEFGKLLNIKRECE